MTAPLFYSRNITDGTVILDEDETHHCNRVLRLHKGDNVNVLDGKGNLYECRLSEPAKKNNKLEILKIEFSGPDPYRVHIALAPTKNNDRTEWFLEKATELGVHEITFLKCRRSERPRINIDRFHRKITSALKQSGNRYLPVVNRMQEFTSFIETSDFPGQKFIAHIGDPVHRNLSESIRPAWNYLILIGPEGDFTDDEILKAEQNNFLTVSLGKSRLRTETAALAGLHTCLVVNQIRKGQDRYPTGDFPGLK